MMKLKKQIVSLCNESKLPIEAVLFVLKDVYRDAEESYIAFEAKKKAQEDQEKTNVE